MRPASFLIPLVLLIFAGPASAQDEMSDAERLERQRQAAFQDKFANIVAGLNAGSFDALVGSIDEDEFLERIFGLRLIDARIKREFRDSMETQFAGMIRSGFPQGEEKLQAQLLGVESRGDRGRAVVRFDLPDLQYNYHEYELALNEDNELVVLDWVDYLAGRSFTDNIGTSLLMASPSEAAVRKLIDYRNVKQSDLFQFRELMKAARDRQAERYIDIIRDLNPELQRQRVLVITTVDLARTIRNRRFLRSGLMQMAEHFPQDPLFSLSLLDYYVPNRKYAEAMAALQRAYDRLGFEDAAMEARLSAIALADGNVENAVAYADEATRLEPGLELAWWSALRAHTAAGDFEAAVKALGKLEGEFGHTLGAEELKADKSFTDLLASDAFGAWVASR